MQTNISLRNLLNFISPKVQVKAKDISNRMEDATMNAGCLRHSQLAEIQDLLDGDVVTIEGQTRKDRMLLADGEHYYPYDMLINVTRTKKKPSKEIRGLKLVNLLELIDPLSVVEVHCPPYSAVLHLPVKELMSMEDESEGLILSRKVAWVSVPPIDDYSKCELVIILQRPNR